MSERFNEDQIDAGRRLFGGPSRFLKGVAKLEQLPPSDGVEIAFAGRSNVGKSSLINALTNVNGLARASNTPGRTRELNFFDVNEALTLVDMPGYGYAKAPKDVVKKWRFLINDYLRGRAVLKRTLVLIDSRHGVKEVDLDVMKMLDEAAVSYRLVLTKADKIKASDLEKVADATRAEARKHAAAFPDVIITSSEKRMGIDELRGFVMDSISE